MDIVRNEELSSLTDFVFELQQCLNDNFPDIFASVQDFTTYSQAVQYLKTHLTKLSDKLLEMHKFVAEKSYGQQFFKLTQDLTQSKNKLKIKEEIISRLQKERKILERELSLLTGKIDSSQIALENESLRKKNFELTEELHRLKITFEQNYQNAINMNIENYEERVIKSYQDIGNTPRFENPCNKSYEKIDKFEKLAQSTENLARSTGNLRKSSEMLAKSSEIIEKNAEKMRRGPESNEVMSEKPEMKVSRKDSETIVELLEAGDLKNASVNWQKFNFLPLETATSNQNIDYLRKTLIFTIKLTESLANISQNPSCLWKNPEVFKKLEEENLHLRARLSEKSNKLSCMHENREAKAKSMQNFYNEAEEIEILKKMVYESSENLIFLENQVKLIKSRAPMMSQVCEIIIGGKITSISKITEYLQAKVCEEIENIKGPLVENLRKAMIQGLKENVSLKHENICCKLKLETMEKLLDEERKMQEFIEKNNGISELDNWKAYKKDYIIRMENAYKNEITELRECINKIKNEIAVASGDVEEKYIKEMQEITAKLRKEHDDKKRLAEIVNKLRLSNIDPELEHQYEECKSLLTEATEKIEVLEKEILQLSEQKHETEMKAQEIEQNLNEAQNAIKGKEKELETLFSTTVHVNEMEKVQEKFKRTKEKKRKSVIEIKQTAEKCQNLYQEMQLLTVEAENLKKKVVVLTEDNKKVVQQLEKSEEVKKSLEQELKELEKTKRDIEKEKKNLEKEKKTIEKEKKEIEKEIRILEKSHNNLEEVIKDQESSMKSQEKEIKQLEKSSRQLIESLKSKTADLLTEKNDLLSQVSSIKVEILSKDQEIQKFKEKLIATESSLQKSQNYQQLYTSLVQTTQTLSNKVKDFYKNFCKEQKIDSPPFKSSNEDQLLSIYTHLIDLCRTLSSTQKRIDVSYEEPQATNDDFKVKYYDLLCKSSIKNVQDGKEIVEQLKTMKSKDCEGLQQWVVDKWQNTIEDCDKLRQELITLSQELEGKMKSENAGIMEKAFEELSSYKNELEKQNSQIISNHMRHNSLLTEIDYLKQEKNAIEKELFMKTASMESELAEWKTCFSDIYKNLMAKPPKSDCSPLNYRNEIMNMVITLAKAEVNVEQVLFENANLIQLSEKYAKDVKMLNEKCEYLESALQMQNENVADSKLYKGEMQEIWNENATLKNKLHDIMNENTMFKEKLQKFMSEGKKDNSREDVGKGKTEDYANENMMLKRKINEVMRERDYLDERIHSLTNESLVKSSYEERAVREALEDELMNKCDLVKQLADEIEKYKKYLKIREYEYQELLTLKDEEILRLRLRSS
ncbi:hypothetical protein SteCoe_33045 [Stentor coeruleus]|uniref:Uncharacterized protein n=1 Tax=Stentor coeruleus TaxID=5963 RepID=A0A1R2AXM8_9CILI|nr:hypothetical protein SteCoe_33045 [Stentor coeruleus]